MCGAIVSLPGCVGASDESRNSQRVSPEEALAGEYDLHVLTLDPMLWALPSRVRLEVDRERTPSSAWHSLHPKLPEGHTFDKNAVWRLEPDGGLFLWCGIMHLTKVP